MSFLGLLFSRLSQYLMMMTEAVSVVNYYMLLYFNRYRFQNAHLEKSECDKKNMKNYLKTKKKNVISGC